VFPNVFHSCWNTAVTNRDCCGFLVLRSLISSCELCVEKEHRHLSSVSVFVRGRKHYKLLVIEVSAPTSIITSTVVKPPTTWTVICAEVSVALKWELWVHKSYLSCGPKGVCKRAYVFRERFVIAKCIVKREMDQKWEQSLRVYYPNHHLLLISIFVSSMYIGRSVIKDGALDLASSQTWSPKKQWMEGKNYRSGAMIWSP
jgi:hypothetical protein